MKVLGANGLQYLITKLMGVDFIVEQGTNGIWKYRKWNSGTAECWAIDSSHTTGSSTTTNFSISLPAGLFSAKPVVNMTQGTASTVDSRVNYVNVTGTSPNFAIDCWIYSALTSKAVTLFIQVIGRWK